MRQEEAEKRKKAIVAVFIAAIMVLSVAGFVMDYAFSEKLSYNGFSFSRAEGGFLTKISGKKIVFNYFPASLENVSVPSEAISLLKKSVMIAITYNPYAYTREQMAEIQFALDKNLPEIFNIYVEKGLTNTTGYEQYKTNKIDCANATAAVPVILFDEAGENETEGIYYSNNCLRLNAKTSQTLLMQTERIIYGIAGVIG